MDANAESHSERGRPPADVPREFGDYELLEEIGRGGQGVVFRAWQRSLNRTVAVKIIGIGQWATDAHLKRLRREAEAAAKLNHPGIVPVYEVGERDGTYYFSMQFVEGDHLDDVVSRGPISVRQAAELMRKSCPHCALRARARHSAPGHQTGKHSVGRRGRTTPDRLWFGPISRTRKHCDWFIGNNGHAQLHVTGTSGG